MRLLALLLIASLAACGQVEPRQGTVLSVVEGGARGSGWTAAWWSSQATVLYDDGSIETVILSQGEMEALRVDDLVTVRDGDLVGLIR